MTDPAGDSCVWRPGGDGYCPGDSGGGGESPPKYHSYGDPRFVDVGGTYSLVVSSSEEGSSGRAELELTTATEDELQAIAATSSIPVAIDCARMCVMASKGADGKVHSMVRTPSGWGLAVIHDVAIRAPAVATFGDVGLVAWATWEEDIGARVELRRLDATGALTGSWTLARGTHHGHLALAASEHGALVTWHRTEESTLLPGGAWQPNAWVVAQVLDENGAPSGTSFEQRVADTDDDYYRAAPAAFVDGAYRVTYGGLEKRQTWLVIDPVNRTIVPTSIGELSGRTVHAIEPDERGAIVSLSGLGHGSLIRVVDETIISDVVINEPGSGPAVTLQPEGLFVAYADTGSIYAQARASDFTPLEEPVLLAERYEIDDGGCSSGRGAGWLVLVPVALLLGRRRR